MNRSRLVIANMRYKCVSLSVGSEFTLGRGGDGIVKQSSLLDNIGWRHELQSASVLGELITNGIQLYNYSSFLD